MHFIPCAQARNQVMQHNHEPAHDNSGCTANLLYNTARPPNRVTNLVGLEDLSRASTAAHKVSCHGRTEKETYE